MHARVSYLHAVGRWVVSLLRAAVTEQDEALLNNTQLQPLQGGEGAHQGAKRLHKYLHLAAIAHTK